MHIADKKALLTKLYVSYLGTFFEFGKGIFLQAWLKPNSRIVITDYCLGAKETTQEHKTYLEKIKYNLISVEDYLQVLCMHYIYANVTVLILGLPSDQYAFSYLTWSLY